MHRTRLLTAMAGPGFAGGCHEPEEPYGIWITIVIVSMVLIIAIGMNLL